MENHPCAPSGGNVLEGAPGVLWQAGLELTVVEHMEASLEPLDAVQSDLGRRNITGMSPRIWQPKKGLLPTPLVSPEVEEWVCHPMF